VLPCCTRWRCRCWRLRRPARRKSCGRGSRRNSSLLRQFSRSGYELATKRRQVRVRRECCFVFFAYRSRRGFPCGCGRCSTPPLFPTATSLAIAPYARLRRRLAHREGPTLPLRKGVMEPPQARRHAEEYFADLGDVPTLGLAAWPAVPVERCKGEAGPSTTATSPSPPAVLVDPLSLIVPAPRLDTVLAFPSSYRALPLPLTWPFLPTLPAVPAASRFGGSVATGAPGIGSGTSEGLQGHETVYFVSQRLFGHFTTWRCTRHAFNTTCHTAFRPCRVRASLRQRATQHAGLPRRPYTYPLALSAPSAAACDIQNSSHNFIKTCKLPRQGRRWQEEQRARVKAQLEHRSAPWEFSAVPHLGDGLLLSCDAQTLKG